MCSTKRLIYCQFGPLSSISSIIDHISYEFQTVVCALVCLSERPSLRFGAPLVFTHLLFVLITASLESQFICIFLFVSQFLLKYLTLNFRLFSIVFSVNIYFRDKKQYKQNNRFWKLLFAINCLPRLVMDGCRRTEGLTGGRVKWFIDWEFLLLLLRMHF